MQRQTPLIESARRGAVAGSEVSVTYDLLRSPSGSSSYSSSPLQIFEKTVSGTCELGNSMRGLLGTSEDQQRAGLIARPLSCPLFWGDFTRRVRASSGPRLPDQGSPQRPQSWAGRVPWDRCRWCRSRCLPERSKHWQRRCACFRRDRPVLRQCGRRKLQRFLTGRAS